MTRRGRAWPLVDARAEDEQVPIDGAGRRGEDEEAAWIAPKPFAQVHAAALAEAGHELSRLRLEREQVLPGAVEDALVLALAPVDDPAIHAERVLFGPAAKGSKRHSSRPVAASRAKAFSPADVA